MANPQKENGYTPIANEILEHMYSFDFTCTEIKILLMIIRFSYGFGRKDAGIAISFFESGLKMNSRTLQREIKKLIDMNVLLVVSEARGTIPRTLKLNKNYEEWGSTHGAQTDGAQTDGVQTAPATVYRPSIATVCRPPNKEKKKNLKKRGEFDPETLLSEKGFSPKIEEAIREWWRYKDERKEAYKETGWEKLLSRFQNRINVYGEQALVEALDRAISSGWKGWDFKSSFPQDVEEPQYKEIIYDD